MNVDVSPDGKRIVFDLLGDIYIMPIDGAPRRRDADPRRAGVRHAAAVQPRRHTDRVRQRPRRPVEHLDDGPGGKNAKQISREKRWFVNSPTWSPDGQYIYARRHFVKERSLGAGEIWMYHAAGAGDGLQVTERNGWQKDAGEPDISPDGRYLYYSKDVTPGQTVRIQQGSERDHLRDHRTRSADRARAPRDQHAGRSGHAAGVTRWQDARLSPPGSSPELPLSSRSRVRPQPSALRARGQGPAGSVGDPRALSAIRVDARRQVDRHLGRRQDLACRRGSGKGTQIPFLAHVEQTLNAAVRFPQKVHPDEFPVRMLRDVRVSPDGKLVVYSALGHLYAKRLPDGEPKRLTADAAYEFFPAFSRDGQWIVYTTWSDADMGRVRVMHTDGSGGRDVVTRPGHYVEPAFSPDGKQIVFRNAGGDDVRSPLYAGEPGVYVVPVAGGSRRSSATADRSRNSITPAPAST